MPPQVARGDNPPMSDKSSHDPAILAEGDAWRSRDLAVVWHPCTQMREHPGSRPLLAVVHGDGAWLVGHGGRRTLDAVSGWWTNLHGHAEPRIGAAIARQAQRLEHVLLAGGTHEGAV